MIGTVFPWRFVQLVIYEFSFKARTYYMHLLFIFIFYGRKYIHIFTPFETGQFNILKIGVGLTSTFYLNLNLSFLFFFFTFTLFHFFKPNILLKVDFCTPLIVVERDYLFSKRWMKKKKLKYKSSSKFAFFVQLLVTINLSFLHFGFCKFFFCLFLVFIS